MEKISVKNYRSIIDSGEIDIKPLTVVVGKNSAGKSSFIRLFPLLKQTLECKVSDSLLWYGDYVDFGDYGHTISKSHANESIKIKISILTHTDYHRSYFFAEEDNDYPVDVELSFKEKYIDQVKITIYDQEVIININDDFTGKLIINGDEESFQNKDLVTIRESGNLLPNVYSESKGDKESYFFRRLEMSKEMDYCMKKIFGSVALKDDSVLRFSRFRDFPISIESKENILRQLQEVNPDKFKNTKVNHKKFINLNNYIIYIKLCEIIDKINRTVSNELRETRYLKPIRAMVNRYYRVQGISIDELDADGSNLPMILKNMSRSQLKAFEIWSKEKFGVVFSVKSGEGHISLIIKDDIGGDYYTNVADTGYGYSQMLPIVMLLWMLHNNKEMEIGTRVKTIVIEQPELHLHPAFQAKMIDVFVNILKEARDNNIDLKIIFETHSETMINRIGLLISEEKIAAEDVNVLIFDKIKDVTQITEKKFNDEGILMGWPIGFFSTEED